MTTKYFDVPFANTGDKTSIPDASQPSGAVSFEDGWTPDYAKDQATDPDAKDIPRQSENYFKFVISEALKELQEFGFKPYDPLVNYPVTAVTLGSDGVQYACQIVNGPASSVVDPVGDVTGTWQKVGQAPAFVIFTASGSYSKPDGLKFIEVTVVGGGGGGGGMDGQGGGTFAAGKPGGGGGASIKMILASALVVSETVTIGAAGAGGAAGNNPGSAGGTTSFGAHCQATGGVGGAGELGSTFVEAHEGTAAGVGSGGDINIDGGPGGISVSLNSNSRGAVSGNGGSSIFSGGGKSENEQNGDSALGYGGGGAGGAGVNLSANFAGGNGSDGIVIIKEFF